MSPRRKKTIPPDMAYVLGRLKLAVQGLGYSLRDIEKRLKTSDGYLSRVFLGTIELKMEHIFGMAKALGMAPEELVAFIYPTPKDPISPAAYQLWRRVGGTPPAAPKPVETPAGGGIKEQDVERVLRQALGRVFGDLAGRIAEETRAASQQAPGAPFP